MRICQSKCRNQFATLTALAISLLAVCLPVSAAADYRANVAKLDAVIKAKPNDESAHYYRAVSLQYLGQYRQAKADYDWVIANGRDAGFRQYSLYAVKGLTRVLFGNGVPSARRDNPVVAALATSAPQPTAVAHSGGAKPKIFEFYTDWCGVCQKHDAEYNALQQEVSSKIDFQRINAEAPENAELRERYAVRHYPTFVFLDGSGTCVFNKAGGFDNQSLKQLIAQKLKI